ncbi:MFS transporter [Paraliomyxa miuraensis]|uniref:MFS transporter n=1 Tax=Paraliomyxa miuraensis TaxID=376150 RepID=UPI0022503BA8|nr:MFS transporter [Paraliomyxa miuraensis]MCX4247364.1 MFS transporter [Paraliomyxa miuraensis]
MNSERSPGRDRLVLLALWLTVLASTSQIMIVAPILPQIGEELHIAPALRGTLVTGFALTLSVFALVVGPISDRVGRRPILLWGSGALAAALLLHPLATGYASMLTVRMLAGVAAGILTGSAIAYIGDYFPYDRRGWASGWVMSGFAVGQVLGVPAGTVLADRFGFGAAFVLFAVLMGGAFVLVLLVVPQPSSMSSAQARNRARLTVGTALRGYMGLLGQRQVQGAALAYATMFFAVSSFVTYMPTWAGQALGMDADGIALLFVVGGISSVLFGPQAGRLSDHFGRKPLIIVSCVGTAVMFALTTVLVTAPTAAYVLFFVAMLLLALRLSPFQALLTALVGDEQRGALMSLVVAIGQLGGGVGAALAGPIYADAGFLGCTLLAAGSILITGLLVAAWIPEPRSDAAPA